MNQSIRLLAIDIDGTLLDSHWQLSTPNREAIGAAQERGIEVVLVTGRRFTFAQPIAAQLPNDLVVIASNGALVKTREGRTLARQLLPRQHARAVLSAAGPDRESAILLFDREGEGQIVAARFDPSHASIQGYFDRNRRFLRRVQKLENALEEEDPIQVLFAGPVEPMRALYSRLQKEDCFRLISLARTEYTERDFTLLDVLAKGCNKGTALGEWARRRGFSREQVMAIGDNWNDHEMLEFAGLPVVMGNSDPELKGKGWAVTGSNDEDGVAAAIQSFLLTD